MQLRAVMDEDLFGKAMDHIKESNCAVWQKRALERIACDFQPAYLRRIIIAQLPDQADELFQEYAIDTGKDVLLKRTAIFEVFAPPPEKAASCVGNPQKQKPVEELRMECLAEWPSFEHVQRFLESNVASYELGVRDYTITKGGCKIATKEDLVTAVAGVCEVSFQVLVCKPEALSGFTYERGVRALTGTFPCSEKHWDLPSCDLSSSENAAAVGNISPSLQTEADVLSNCGMEVAIRCQGQDPLLQKGEQSKRSVIGSVLHNVKLVVGSIEVVEEFGAVDQKGSGAVDFAACLGDFGAALLEAKDKNLISNNEGQLCASMGTVRSQFMNNHMCQPEPDTDTDIQKPKRRRLSIELAPKKTALKQVPALGVLSNGVHWKCYRYDFEQEVLWKSAMIAMPLKEDMSAVEASEAVRPVFCHLVAILRQQVAAFHKFAQTNPDWLRNNM